VSYTEVDVFGVLISPLFPMLILTFALLELLRWAFIPRGWTRWPWHPALFIFSIYLIILSLIVLALGRWNAYV